jgi:hypothetical protein
MENFVTKVQKVVVVALPVLLLVVVVLSTAHLGVLVAEEIWKPPRFLIPVQGLLDIFGFFLLVLIGVELLDTVKAYFKKGCHSCSCRSRSGPDCDGQKSHHRGAQQCARIDTVWYCGSHCRPWRSLLL